METLRTILVVEDEEFLREGIVNLLTAAGWNVYQAADGAEAVRIFREYPIEIVLSDLLMPRINGLQLLRTIQEIDPDIPVIILTGYGTMERCVAALRGGAADFLAKPFDVDALMAALNRAWEGRGRDLENETIIRNSECHLRISLPQDLSLIFSAISQIEAITRPLGYYRRRWAIKRATEEVLKNAIIHGAGPVNLEAFVNNSAFKITVEDSGKGFSLPETESRGIFLIRSFADEARWIEPGNKVEIIFKR